MMAKSNLSPRPIAEFAETTAILDLLGQIEQRRRSPKPEPEPEPAMIVVEQAPASAFIIYEPSQDLRFESEPAVEMPPPLPPPLPEPVELPPPLPELFETAVPMQSFAQSFSWETTVVEVAAPPPVEIPQLEPHVSPRETASVPRPVGAMLLGEFFAHVNWRNRPEDAKPQPMIGTPEPPRFEDTVEAVRSAFDWDDE